MWIKEAKIYYKIVIRGVLEFRYYYYDPDQKIYIFLGQWMRYYRRGYKKMTPKILYNKLRLHNYIPCAQPTDLKRFFIGNILT